MDDLQTFLAQYAREFPTAVCHIESEVPRGFYSTAAVLEAERLADPPVLIFDRMGGASMPVVTNVFASRARIAFALGTTLDQLPDYWIAQQGKLIPPELVNLGASQEVCHLGDEANAEWLPALTHFQQDAGPYITSGVFIAKDPDHGWGNLSFHRMQLKGPRRFGTSLHSRAHLWDYQRRAELQGRALEVAVVVGMHPAYLIAATSRVPIEVDETDIAGAFLGHPLRVVQCKTVDLQVPADAEIVLEGAIESGKDEQEGPFGEYTRHSSGRSTNHVFKLRAITHRSNPVFLDICPGGSHEHLNLGQVPAEAGLLKKVRESFPDVKALFTPYSGTIYHCYVSVKKRRASDGRQLGLLLLGLDPYLKLVVVVDDDVDVFDEAQVLWAMATRMQAGRDAIIVDDMTCNLLDPSSSKSGTSSKMAIDATIPEGFEAERLTLPADALKWAKETFGALLQSPPRP